MEVLSSMENLNNERDTSQKHPAKITTKLDGENVLFASMKQHGILLLSCKGVLKHVSSHYRRIDNLRTITMNKSESAELMDKNVLLSFNDKCSSCHSQNQTKYLILQCFVSRSLNPQKLAPLIKEQCTFSGPIVQHFNTNDVYII